MERHVMWVPWEEPGLEHLHLIHNNENIIADSMILGVYQQCRFGCIMKSVAIVAGGSIVCT